MKFLSLVSLAILSLLTACASPTPRDYTAVKPTLDIRDYFNGTVDGWGIIYDYSGKVDRHFTVLMQGTWKGNVGTVHETFTYNTGRVDKRVWHVTFSDDHHFTATAHDVVGTSIGSQYGNAANTKYLLNTRRDSGGTIVLSMDDWLHMIDEKTVMNPITMRKFGITVGTGVITFRKR